MITLGLTGSIGMGKSTAAQQLRQMGLPVFEADAAVHELYQSAEIREQIRAILPPEYRGESFNRNLVARAVLIYPELLKKLEGILHPQVRAMEQEFLYRAREQAHRIAILDIPLLFETGEESRCDYIAVVTAPKLIQAWRVLRRPGMSLHKLNIILSRQMGDAEKRSRADFVVHTGFGKWVSGLQWKNILKRLMHSAISSSNAQN
ncbi:MAG: dephospho-CoA kinase [Alphaproteobacteria bacterium]|nr:MAG: dephospho-CoA kinase [Alphaproteobacteria bacterium]